MDAVYGIRRNVNGTLKTESHVRPVYVIVNGLGKVNNVQPLLAQQIGRFLCAVSSQDHQAVKIQLVKRLLHGLDLIQTVFIRHPHLFKRLSGRAKDRSSFCENSGKIRGRR